MGWGLGQHVERSGCDRNDSTGKKKYCTKHKTSTSGTDGICSQTILYMHPRVKDKIVQWVNACLTGEDEALQLLQQLMQMDRMNLIPKVTPVKEVKHLRPITVSATLLRVVLEQIRIQYGKVLDRVVPQDRRNHQYGFTKKRGAKDLAALLQMYWEMEEEIHLVSVDIEKAYDNLSRAAVEDMMAIQNWPATYQQIIRQSTDLAKAELHYGDKKMQIGAQGRGIKQGAPESPAIFSAVLDMVILPLRRKFSTWVQEENTSCLLYADDIVLIARSAEGAELLIKELQKGLNRIGLNINMDKTGYIVKGEDQRPLFVQDTVIPVSEDLTHLGINVVQPELPKKALTKIQKLMTWAYTSGYSKMVITEVVMAKVMGSVNYYLAMTAAEQERAGTG